MAREPLPIQEKITMLRLFIAIVLLLISLLVLFKAPTNLAWLITVLTSNFPYIFIIGALVSLGISFNYERFKWACLSCSCVAFILYSVPVVKIYQKGKELEAQFPKLFPVANDSSMLKQPFSITKMFTGIGVKKIAYKTLVYKKTEAGELTLDYYPSATPGNSPVIIVIHGGSWESGDSKQLPALNSYLAREGYNIAAIN